MVGVSRYHLQEPVHIHTWMQGQKQIILHLPLKSKFHCIIFRARGFFHHHCQIPSLPFPSLPFPTLPFFPIHWNLGCFLMCSLQASSGATQKFWLIGIFIVYWTQRDHSYSRKILWKTCSQPWGPQQVAWFSVRQRLYTEPCVWTWARPFKSFFFFW